MHKKPLFTLPKTPQKAPLCPLKAPYKPQKSPLFPQKKQKKHHLNPIKTIRENLKKHCCDI